MTAVIADVPWVEDGFREAAVNFGTWLRRVDENPRSALIVRQAADIVEAKASGRVGVIFSSQTPTVIESDLRLLRVLYAWACA